MTVEKSFLAKIVWKDICLCRFDLYSFYFVYPRTLGAPWSKIVASFGADDPLS